MAEVTQRRGGIPYAPLHRILAAFVRNDRLHLIQRQVAT